jgi:hypothetical protein
MGWTAGLEIAASESQKEDDDGACDQNETNKG